MLDAYDFVLESEFLALQFGDFRVGRGRVGDGVSQFGLKGLVLGVQFTQMRLKTHAILHSGYDNSIMT